LEKLREKYNLMRKLQDRIFRMFRVLHQPRINLITGFQSKKNKESLKLCRVLQPPSEIPLVVLVRVQLESIANINSRGARSTRIYILAYI
jgi:hypothetical protein